MGLYDNHAGKSDATVSVSPESQGSSKTPETLEVSKDSKGSESLRDSKMQKRESSKATRNAEKESMQRNVPSTKKKMKLRTEVDDILELLSEKEHLSLEEIAQKTGMKVNQVEYWASRLAKAGTIQVKYPIIGKTWLKIMKDKKDPEGADTTERPLGEVNKDGKGKKLMIFTIAVVVIMIGIILLLKKLNYLY